MKSILKRKRRSERRKGKSNRGWTWSVKRMKRKRSIGFRKRKFLCRWKRRVKGNIEKCQRRWASFMDELKEKILSMV